MKHRRPPLDFAGVPANWSRDAGVAAFLNAGGALAPAVEPYLNRVMSEAARRLGPKQAALRADIKTLVQQETEHFKLHEAFNQALYAQGFSGLESVVDDLKRALNLQFRSRSFAFNLAWCVGFETLTLHLAAFLLGPGAHHLDGAEPRAAALWRWHLAEEYEHRTVCHDAYRALVGDYPLRLGAMLYGYAQIADYRRRALEAMAQGANMRRRHDRFAATVALALAPHLLPALLPFHDPAHAPPPPGLNSALEPYAEAA